MIVPDDAAATLDPFDIDAIGDIAARATSAKIRMTPSVNGKLRKLCAYFAASDQDENAFGPISGSSTSLPNVMLRPGQRQDNETGRRHPVHETFEAVKRTILTPERPDFDPHHAAR